MLRNPRLLAVYLVLTVALGAPSTAGANGDKWLRYEQCYEVAALRPAPVAELEQHMPPGFSVRPVIDPTGTVSAYVSVGYHCLVGSGSVTEVLDLVPVVPPPHLTGQGADYLLLRGTTSDPLSRVAYASWCVDVHHGAVQHEAVDAMVARAVAFTAEHPDGGVSLHSAAPGAATGAVPAGRLRVISAYGDDFGFFDIAFSPAASVGPVPATWTDGDGSEPALAVHVIPAPDAPNTWEIDGRPCVP